MKKILTMLIILSVMISFAHAAKYEVIANSNSDILFNCWNATGLAGTAATVNVTDRSNNVDLATQSATVKGSGVFNITVNLPEDVYTIHFGCSGQNTFTYTSSLKADLLRSNVLGAVSGNASVTNGYIDTEITEISTGLKQNGTLISRTVGALDGNSTFWNVWDDSVRTLTTADWLTSTQGYDVNTSIHGKLNTSLTNENTLATQITNVNSSLYLKIANVTAEVWNAGTRTLSAFAFSVTVGTNNDKTGYALSTAGVEAVDTQLNSSHGKGEWNNTNSGSASISVGDINQIIKGATGNVSVNLSGDHSAGNWSDKGGSATISQADILQIANQTMFYNASGMCTTNSTLNRDRFGKYVCDIWKFRG